MGDDFNKGFESGLAGETQQAASTNNAKQDATEKSKETESTNANTEDKKTNDSDDAGAKDGNEKASENGDATNEQVQETEEVKDDDKGETKESESAADALEKRAKEKVGDKDKREDSSKDTQDSDEGESESDDDDDEASFSPDSFFKDKSIGKLKIKNADGEVQKLSEFAEEFPEMATAAFHIANKLVESKLQKTIEKEIEGRIKAGKLLTSDTANELRLQLANQQFWSEVTESHPDGRKVVKSNEFKEWFGKQSRVVQALGKSMDVDDGVAVLNAFKESVMKQKKAEEDKKMSEQKKRTDDIHKSTLRSKNQETPKKEKEDSFDAGFNKGLQSA